MRKGCAVLFALFAISAPVFAFPCARALAHHKEAVLGEATPASELVFPPVTAGPGFLLPDSPLFFLDQMFQSVRLMLAFDNRSRANVRAQIAGERLSELRIMVSRSNEQGITTALTLLTGETDQAAKNVSDAAASGQDVAREAKQLNETIKLHRDILGRLSDQASGTFRLQLKAARKALKEAKVEVEDELEEDELDREVEEDLEDEIDERVEEAESAATGLERAIDVLTRLASEAAVKQQARREEAIRRAIEVKNETLQRLEEKQLHNERKKQDELLKLRKEAAEQARETVKKAQEAAKRFEKVRERTLEIKKTEDGTTGSSGSGKSGD